MAQRGIPVYEQAHYPPSPSQATRFFLAPSVFVIYFSPVTQRFACARPIDRCGTTRVHQNQSSRRISLFIFILGKGQG